ncbi:hypothetical protein [Streptomyces sp. CT34]|nr:hypothetical protein [Streptomyces sp. CT34]
MSVARAAAGPQMPTKAAPQRTTKAAPLRCAGDSDISRYCGGANKEAP